MKKILLCIVIAILFIALFLMPMAWGVLGKDDIAQLQNRVDQARYKEDLYLPAADRLEFMGASKDSEAGKAYQLFCQKKEALPSDQDLNWSEKIYYEHELIKHGWKKAAAQMTPKKS